MFELVKKASLTPIIANVVKVNRVATARTRPISYTTLSRRKHWATDSDSVINTASTPTIKMSLKTLLVSIAATNRIPGSAE
jgi:hypothetical protein